MISIGVDVSGNPNQYRKTSIENRVREVQAGDSNSNRCKQDEALESIENIVVDLSAIEIQIRCKLVQEYQSVLPVRKLGM